MFLASPYYYLSVSYAFLTCAQVVNLSTTDNTSGEAVTNHIFG